MQSSGALAVHCTVALPEFVTWCVAGTCDELMLEEGRAAH